MGDMTAAQFKIFISALLFATVLATGCAKKHNGSGGQDGGGGGHVRASTAEEVRAAIEHAIALAKEPELERNVFFSIISYKRSHLNNRYFGTMGKYDKEFEKERIAEIRKWKGIFAPVIAGIPSSCYDDSLNWQNPEVDADPLEPGWQGTSANPEIQLKCKRYFANNTEETNAYEKNYFSNMISKSHFIYKASGDCGSQKDNHADASVSKFAIGADICFSLENLQRIPPSALLREVMSLLAHEAAHLSGFQESEANFVQEQFSEYFADRFGGLSAENADLNFQNRFIDIENAIQRLSAEALDKGMRSLMWLDLGKASTATELLPFLNDPMALEIIFNPPRAAAIQAYLYTAWQLGEHLHDLTAEIDSQLCPAKGERCNDKEIDQQKLAAELDFINHQLRIIAENWQVISIDKGEIVCEPEQKRKINSYKLWFFLKKNSHSPAVSPPPCPN